jgi:amylosucrase
MEKRAQPATVEGRIFTGLRDLIHIRKGHKAFSVGELNVISTDNDHILGFVRRSGTERMLILANFSETPITIPGNLLRLYGLSYTFTERITNTPRQLTDIELEAYQLVILQSNSAKE